MIFVVTEILYKINNSIIIYKIELGYFYYLWIWKLLHMYRQTLLTVQSISMWKMYNIPFNVKNVSILIIYLLAWINLQNSPVWLFSYIVLLKGWKKMLLIFK